MPSSEKEKLLREVIADPNHHSFRRDLRALALEEFRAARKNRKIIRVAPWLALAATIALATGVFWSMPHQNRPAEIRVPATALPQPNDTAIAVVVSQPVPPSVVVRSVPSRGDTVTTRLDSASYLEMVRTEEETIPEIDNAGLLALFPNEPAGFLTGPNGPEFILIGSRDRPFEAPHIE